MKQRDTKRGSTNEPEVEQRRQQLIKQKRSFDSQDSLIADPIDTFSQEDDISPRQSKRVSSNEQHRQRPKKQKSFLDSQDPLLADPIETFSSQEHSTVSTQEYNQPIRQFTTVEEEVEELSFEHESSFEHGYLLNSSLDNLLSPAIPSDEEDNGIDEPFLFDTVQNDPIQSNTQISEISSIEGFTTDEEEEEVINSDVESFAEEESAYNEEENVPPLPAFEFILPTLPGTREPPKFLKGGLAEKAFNLISNEKKEYSKWLNNIQTQMSGCGSVAKFGDKEDGEFYLFRMLDVWEEKGMIYSWCVALDDNVVKDIIKPSPQSSQVTGGHDSIQQFSSQPVIRSLPPYEEKQDDLKTLFAFSFAYLNGTISLDKFKKDKPIAIWTPYESIDVNLEDHGEIEVNLVTRFMADAFY